MPSPQVAPGFRTQLAIAGAGQEGQRAQAGEFVHGFIDWQPGGELIFEEPSFGIKVFCGECQPFLNSLAADAIDTIVSDPPYGISVITRTYQNKETKPGKALAHKTQYPKSEEWDDEIPPPEYFAEIQRVGKQQVIFGGNYFAHLLPPSSSWIV